MNAIAVFDSPDVKGTFRFHQCSPDAETVVMISLKGLEPGKVYGNHIHEYGDTTDGCKSLGGHWNPEGKEHGSIFVDINRSHAGDLINNIKADRNGSFKLCYKDSRLRLYPKVSDSIIGCSVVIHKGVDDLGLGDNAESKITGNAGKRLACAVIGKSKPGSVQQ